MVTDSVNREFVLIYFTSELFIRWTWFCEFKKQTSRFLTTTAIRFYLFTNAWLLVLNIIVFVWYHNLITRVWEAYGSSALV